MERRIKTRVKDGAPQVETVLTIDFTGVTREELEEQAARSLVIDKQNEYRKAGSIPTEDTLNVRELLDTPRKPRGPVDVAAMLAKMDPETRAALLAKFAE